MSNAKVTVKYLPTTDEWVARIFINGERQAARDYYTSDKDDAENTAAAMLEEEEIAFNEQSERDHDAAGPHYDESTNPSNGWRHPEED